MNTIELTEAFLAKIAGWEAMKQARGLLELDQVLSSNWTPPVLKGVVQEGSISYRAGLVIKDAIDLENLCTCRASRQWGTMCAHSVAVGLHHLRGANAAIAKPSYKTINSAAAHSTPTQIPTSNAPAKQPRKIRRSETGEPAEIYVILPLNLGPAVAKGRITICFEAKWSRGRSLLDALPAAQEFNFSESDLRLLDAIESITERQIAGMIALPIGKFAQLLSALTDHPRVSLGRAQPVMVASTPARVPLSVTLLDSGELRLCLDRFSPASVLVMGEPSWVFHGHEFQTVGLPKTFQSLFTSSMHLTRNQVPVFLTRDWPVLESCCELRTNFRACDFILEPQPPKFFLSLSGGLAQLQAQLQCAYGARIMTLGVTANDESCWMPDPQLAMRYLARDRAAEQSALARLTRAGFSAPDEQGRLQLLGQNAVLNFFARLYPRLEKEWNVTMEARLEKSTAQNLERIEPRFQITPSGEQWFDFNVTFGSASGERFSDVEIQRLIRSGQSHTRLRNGRIALIDTGAVEELQEVLLDCEPEQQSGAYRLKNIQAGYLELALRQQPNWPVQAPEPWRARAAQQSGEMKLEPPALGELDSVLRPYQKHGVAWLHFLRENQFGGILADEMGLGKTLQTLAFLQSVSNSRASQEFRPSLVVCPTSLVPNWVAEAKRFSPGLRVLAVHGPDRQGLFSQIGQEDLIVTSYALIRRDAEHYRNLEFDTVVLDEAQHIKNRQSQNAQAVKAVRSQHRLVLTGTPLENSVLDLWSIFDFLMPGYLGSAADFRERYEVPIARERNAEAQARLARRVRPFLLRRLKRDVAPELPQKIEQIAFCELTVPQRALYQQVLDAGRREVLETVQKHGVPGSRMAVLNALLRLRQICCDMRLLNLENIDPEQASGKLDLFRELLDEVIDGGHRVLVFSQFVRMLSLIKAQLDSEEIKFCYLDGATVNRADVVDQFQKDASIPVFLISLKAGGVGLNLPGADTVIHFDPWWNPAVEDQATDRAHRIGQTRVVTSLKLITRDTVEEKILNLQNRKRSVTKTLLEGDEAFAESLTWKEIQEVLAG